MLALPSHRSKTLDARGRPNGPIWQTRTQPSGTQRGHRRRTWQPRCNTKCLEWATSTQRSNVERRTRGDGALVENARVSLPRATSYVLACLGAASLETKHCFLFCVVREMRFQVRMVAVFVVREFTVVDVVHLNTLLHRVQLSSMVM